MTIVTRRQFAIGSSLLALGALPARAAEPIKIGFSESLTGGLAASGKAALLTKQIWLEQVNAKGGLLGRPVQLVYYDDQSTPANAPAIYAKLLDIDKVDFVMGNGTNITAAVMPIVIQHNKLIVTQLALAVNTNFKYPRFFQTMPYGPDGKEQFALGFFGAAMTLDPKPQSVALIGADAEFALNSLEGARKIAKQNKLKIVFDRTYPPSMVEFGSIIRSIQATNPDLVFVAGYPPDSSGMLRAALEGGLKTRMFGGGMVGLQYAVFKQQFGEGLNGVVNYETYIPAATTDFPGIKDFIAEYRKRAAGAQVDMLGHYVPPLIFATMQIIGQAVEGAGTVDNEKLAAHMHKAKFSTVMGDVAFGPDGEWTKGRVLMTQFRNVKGNGLEQFDTPGTQVILYPPEYKTGDVMPFSATK